MLALSTEYKCKNTHVERQRERACARVRGRKQRNKRRGGETTLEKGDEKSKAKGNAGNAQGRTSTDGPQELTTEAVYLTTSARTQTRDATLVRHASRCLTATTQSTDT